MTDGYIFYCDGAVSGNPGGPGGYGVVMLTPEGGVQEFGAFEPETTNQRTEMLAAIRALQELPHSCTGTIVSDSQYVVKGITEWIHNWIPRGWTNANGKPTANQDLWETMHALNQDRDVTWKHVRGHRGIPGNERADVLAVAFKLHKTAELYIGNYEDYGIDLTVPT